MLNKIWRYSHFYLTVSSFVFLLLATVTGAFLAFKPIQQKLQPFYVDGAEHITLAQLADTLNSKYDEVIDVEIDKNYFVTTTVFSLDDELNGQFYINPFTGDKIANIPSKSAFFEFLTNFHRSLFLKTPGRIFVGLTCFFLLLIAISGLLLAIKRQGGLVKLFSKIINDGSIQYNHVALGRLLLIPIIILTLSGTYLSMHRFSLLPDSKPVSNQLSTTKSKTLPLSEFRIFKSTPLKEVQKLEFPFSPEDDDFFLLNLHDKALKIHQKTGEVVETTHYPFVKIASVLSFNLHTGTGSIVWSTILFFSALSILYFMYSGIFIAIKRLSTKTKNKFSAHTSEYIILVGSENGSTKRLGKVLQQALLKADKKVYLDDLNNYRAYPNIKQLIIITSTYGQGEPPSNANLFLEKLQKTKVEHPFKCSVIGFGSYSYPKFCEFAKNIYTQLSLQNHIQLTSQQPLLIHNQNFEQFRNRCLGWGKSIDLDLDIPKELSPKKHKEIELKVINKEYVKDGFSETFTLSLSSKRRVKIVPGDLLGIIPPNETTERLYSIGQNTNGNVLLSVKRHSHGACSNYLYRLNPSEALQATIQKNKQFHFPKRSKNVILIANGTGIAPFLGMIQQKTKASVSLYWGTRTKTSEALYKNQILEAQQAKRLKEYHVCFSKENTPFNYVQDMLERDQEQVAQLLNNGGSIMICGSTAMRDQVFSLLENICLKHKLLPFSTYKNKGLILTDCY